MGQKGPRYVFMQDQEDQEDQKVLIIIINLNTSYSN